MVIFFDPLCNHMLGGGDILITTFNILECIIFALQAFKHLLIGFTSLSWCLMYYLQ